jgi:hypothetical protein
MKMLFCMIFRDHIFSNIHHQLAVSEIVESPEEAAILVWGRNQLISYPEPDQYDAHLYEVDFGEMTVKEIDIPKVYFETE